MVCYFFKVKEWMFTVSRKCKAKRKTNHPDLLLQWPNEQKVTWTWTCVVIVHLLKQLVLMLHASQTGKQKRGKQRLSVYFSESCKNNNFTQIPDYILMPTSQSLAAPFSFALHQWKSCSQSCSHCSQLIDRNMSVSTSQHWTNIQNLRAAKTLSPLISQPTSQTRKQPDNPQPKAKGKQESTPSTAESKQGRGEIYISQSGPRHSGLGKSKQ